MAKIREILIESNRWWKQEYRIDYKERQVYKKISKFLPQPQIIAFTGLRRVGKTTLMLKIVEDFIENGFEPEDIVYFSFDEFRAIEIRDVMKEYEELMGKKFGEGRYLLLFDEIQKLDNWEEQVKRVYDTFKENVKIVISGSESLFIRKKSRETLAGRMFEFRVDPLNFKEFLAFKEVEYSPIGLYERELRLLFTEFIYTFGFPELVDIKDKEVIKKYVKEGIIEKTIYKDMPKLFNVSDPSILESLLSIIMEGPGQLMELSNLAKELGISRQTVSNYLTYLEDSFLIRRLYNFSMNRRKTERKLKKYYPTIISPNLLFRQDDLSRSKVFECFIVNQLNAEFFWRDSSKNEVDVILTPDNELIPIEIKYGRIETKALRIFMKKFKASKGYVLSSTHEEKQQAITVVQAYRFLLESPTWEDAS